MAITNTRNNPRIEWLMGVNPRAIEEQEAIGQQELAESSQLPVKVNYPRDGNAKKIYKELGIRVISKSKDDDLFFDVRLPAGWKVKPTYHDMWSELVDDDGTIRAHIFYKAAFYDRDAFINIEGKQ